MRPPSTGKSEIAKNELRARNLAYKRGQKIAREAEKLAQRAVARARGPRRIKIKIDVARFRNAGPVARVHVDAWRLAYRAIMPEKILRSLTYQRFEQKWEELIAAAEDTGIFTLIAIEEEDGIVGFVRAGPSDEQGANGEPPVRAYEIFSLNVTPKYQRRGIGERLFKEAAARIRAEGGDALFLWVLSENKPARWMFKKRGGLLEGRGVDKLGPARLPKVAYAWDDLDRLIDTYVPETFDPAVLETIRLPAIMEDGPDIPEPATDPETGQSGTADPDPEPLDPVTAAEVEALAEAGA